MCFRPAEISMKKCPVCGADNKPIAIECEECGAPLEETKFDFDADQASLDAMNTFAPPPGMPGAPSSPGMPPVPGMPPSPPMPPTPPMPPKPPSAPDK